MWIPGLGSKESQLCKKKLTPIEAHKQKDMDPENSQKLTGEVQKIDKSAFGDT